MGGSPLIIRADAGAQMGTGHVMRCLALAQAWQDQGGGAVFAMCQAPPALESRLLAEGMEVVRLAAPPGSAEDARETTVLARDRGAEWLVVDGYQFGADYQHLVKESGLALLSVDDYGHAEHYWADLVLNQNVSAHEGLYPNREPYTRLLLGTRYVMLRREFLKWRDWRREIPEVARKILVTLGGGDPDNVTAKVLQALEKVDLEGLEAVVLAGGANPHLEELKAQVAALPFPVRLATDVTNMPELMTWADVGITGGGSTCWETAFLGLPCLVIVLADNQRPIAERLQELQAMFSLGWHANLNTGALAKSIHSLLESTDWRREMSVTSQGLVDGEGPDRVIMHLKNEPVRLRPVRETDGKLLWEWANEPEARAASFSQHYISWEEHTNWFQQKLNDQNCIYFIALNGDEKPLGQVRFDIQGEQAEIDISIDKRERSLGLGRIILNGALTYIFNKSDIDTINAFIKPDNIKSIKAFEKVGFKMTGFRIIKDNNSLHYIRKKYMNENHFLKHYIVAGSKSWNRRVFEEVIKHYPGDWHFFQSPQDLNLSAVRTINPYYIFFLHWSWKVPDEILNDYECICFHMTDVPYGRGGSPLQNLIMRGHQKTKLTALKMVSDFDAGPVYYKEDLCLHGNAEEIYIRATYLSAQIIKIMVSEEPIPIPQKGDIVSFQRRNPGKSEIPELPSLDALYDFIRMLDADGYPRAFLTYGNYRLEFSRVSLYNGRIVADVTISSLKEPQ